MESLNNSVFFNRAANRTLDPKEALPEKQPTPPPQKLFDLPLSEEQRSKFPPHSKKTLEFLTLLGAAKEQLFLRPLSADKTKRLQTWVETETNHYQQTVNTALQPQNQQLLNALPQRLWLPLGDEKAPLWLQIDKTKGTLAFYDSSDDDFAKEKFTTGQTADRQPLQTQHYHLYTVKKERLQPEQFKLLLDEIKHKSRSQAIRIIRNYCCKGNQLPIASPEKAPHLYHHPFTQFASKEELDAVNRLQIDLVNSKTLAPQEATELGQRLLFLSAFNRHIEALNSITPLDEKTQLMTEPLLIEGCRLQKLGLLKAEEYERLLQANEFTQAAPSFTQKEAAPPVTVRALEEIALDDGIELPPVEALYGKPTLPKTVEEEAADKAKEAKTQAVEAPLPVVPFLSPTEALLKNSSTFVQGLEALRTELEKMRKAVLQTDEKGVEKIMQGYERPLLINSLKVVIDALPTPDEAIWQQLSSLSQEDKKKIAEELVAIDQLIAVKRDFVEKRAKPDEAHHVFASNDDAALHETQSMISLVSVLLGFAQLETAKLISASNQRISKMRWDFHPFVAKMRQIAYLPDPKSNSKALKIVRFDLKRQDDVMEVLASRRETDVQRTDMRTTKLKRTRLQTEILNLYLDQTKLLLASDPDLKNEVKQQHIELQKMSFIVRQINESFSKQDGLQDGLINKIREFLKQKHIDESKMGLNDMLFFTAKELAKEENEAIQRSIGIPFQWPAAYTTTDQQLAEFYLMSRTPLEAADALRAHLPEAKLLNRIFLQENCLADKETDYLAALSIYVTDNDAFYHYYPDFDSLKKGLISISKISLRFGATDDPLEPEGYGPALGPFFLFDTSKIKTFENWDSLLLKNINDLTNWERFRHTRLNQHPGENTHKLALKAMNCDRFNAASAAIGYITSNPEAISIPEVRALVLKHLFNVYDIRRLAEQERAGQHRLVSQVLPQKLKEAIETIEEQIKRPHSDDSEKSLCYEQLCFLLEAAERFKRHVSYIYQEAKAADPAVEDPTHSEPFLDYRSRFEKAFELPYIKAENLVTPGSVYLDLWGSAAAPERLAFYLAATSFDQKNELLIRSELQRQNSPELKKDFLNHLFYQHAFMCNQGPLLSKEKTKIEFDEDKLTISFLDKTLELPRKVVDRDKNQLGSSPLTRHLDSLPLTRHWLTVESHRQKAKQDEGAPPLPNGDQMSLSKWYEMLNLFIKECAADEGKSEDVLYPSEQQGKAIKALIGIESSKLQFKKIAAQDPVEWSIVGTPYVCTSAGELKRLQNSPEGQRKLVYIAADALSAQEAMTLSALGYDQKTHHLFKLEGDQISEISIWHKERMEPDDKPLFHLYPNGYAVRLQDGAILPPQEKQNSALQDNSLENIGLRHKAIWFSEKDKKLKPYSIDIGSNELVFEKGAEEKTVLKDLQASGSYLTERPKKLEVMGLDLMQNPVLANSLFYTNEKGGVSFDLPVASSEGSTLVRIDIAEGSMTTEDPWALMAALMKLNEPKLFCSILPKLPLESTESGYKEKVLRHAALFLKTSTNHDAPSSLALFAAAATAGGLLFTNQFDDDLFVRLVLQYPNYLALTAQRPDLKLPAKTERLLLTVIEKEYARRSGNANFFTFIKHPPQNIDLLMLHTSYRYVYQPLMQPRLNELFKGKKPSSLALIDLQKWAKVVQQINQLKDSPFKRRKAAKECAANVYNAIQKETKTQTLQEMITGCKEARVSQTATSFISNNIASFYIAIISSTTSKSEREELIRLLELRDPLEGNSEENNSCEWLLQLAKKPKNNPTLQAILNNKRRFENEKAKCQKKIDGIKARLEKLTEDKGLQKLIKTTFFHRQLEIEEKKLASLPGKERQKAVSLFAASHISLSEYAGWFFRSLPALWSLAGYGCRVGRALPSSRTTLLRTFGTVKPNSAPLDTAQINGLLSQIDSEFKEDIAKLKDVTTDEKIEQIQDKISKLKKNLDGQQELLLLWANMTKEEDRAKKMQRRLFHKTVGWQQLHKLIYKKQRYALEKHLADPSRAQEIEQGFYELLAHKSHLLHLQRIFNIAKKLKEAEHDLPLSAELQRQLEEQLGDESGFRQRPIAIEQERSRAQLFIEAVNSKGYYRLDQLENLDKMENEEAERLIFESPTGTGKTRYYASLLSQINKTQTKDELINDKKSLKRAKVNEAKVKVPLKKRINLGLLKKTHLNLYPQQLFKITASQAKESEEQALQKEVVSIAFSRNSSLDPITLEALTAKLEEGRRKGITLQIDDKALCTLVLRYLELCRLLSKGKATKEEGDIALQLVRLLRFLFTSTTILSDEEDTLFDATKLTTFAQSDEENLPDFAVSCANSFFSWLMTEKEFEEFQKFILDNELIKPEQIEALIGRLLDSDALMRKIADHLAIPHEQIAVLRGYLKEEEGALQPQVAEDRLKELCLFKGYMTGILSAAMKGKCGEHFGFSKKHPETHPEAIPWEKGSPVEDDIRPSCYKNTDERLLKTMRTLHTFGMNRTKQVLLLNSMVETYQKEIAIDPKMPLADSAVYGDLKTFIEVVEKSKSAEVQNIDDLMKKLLRISPDEKEHISPRQYLGLLSEQQAANIGKDHKMISCYLKHYVAPRIRHYPDSYSISPQDLLRLLPKMVSMSATPQKEQLHAIEAKSLRAKGAEKEAERLFLKCVKSIEPLAQSDNALFDEVVKRYVESKVRAVVDPCAQLSHLKNSEVALQLAEKFKNVEGAAKTIVFFDQEAGKLMCLDVQSKKTRLYVEEQHLPQETLTFYSKGEYVGTDIVQEPLSGAIVLARESMTVKELEQACGRMRKRDEGQFIVVMQKGLDEKEKATGAEQEKLQLFFERYKRNEEELGKQRNLMTFENMIEAEVYCPMLQRMLGLPTESRKKGKVKAPTAAETPDLKRLLRQYRRFEQHVLKHEPYDPVAAYGSQVKKSGQQLLIERQAKALRDAKRYFKGDEAKRVKERLNHYPAMWSKVALPEKTHGAKTAAAQEVALKTSVHENLEKNLQIDLPSDKKPDHFYWDKSDLWPETLEALLAADFSYIGSFLNLKLISSIKQQGTNVLFYPMKDVVNRRYKNNSGDCLSNNFFVASDLAAYWVKSVRTPTADYNKPLTHLMVIFNGKQYVGVAVDNENAKHITKLIANCKKEHLSKSIGLYDINLGVFTARKGVIDEKSESVVDLQVQAMLLAGQTRFKTPQQQKALANGVKRAKGNIKAVYKLHKQFTPSDMPEDNGEWLLRIAGLMGRLSA